MLTLEEQAQRAWQQLQTQSDDLAKGVPEDLYDKVVIPLSLTRPAPPTCPPDSGSGANPPINRNARGYELPRCLDGARRNAWYSGSAAGSWNKNRCPPS